VSNEGEDELTSEEEWGRREKELQIVSTLQMSINPTEVVQWNNANLCKNVNPILTLLCSSPQPT
jgi:hypothetical protein